MAQRDCSHVWIPPSPLDRPGIRASTELKYPRPMARRKHKPFGGSLEIERGGDELLGRDLGLPKVADLDELAREGMERGVDRVDRLAPANKAVIYSIVGGAACAGLWGVKLFWKDAMARLAAANFFPLLVVAVSCIAAYGLLMVVLGPVVAPVPTAKGVPFGGFVEARGDEAKWKRRLLAAGLGIVHAAIFAWV